MSRDIRSFFVKKDGGSTDMEHKSISGGKKRTLRVIESDSDDDVIVERPAQKKQKEGQSKSVAKEKKKEITKSPVDVNCFFGLSPVKQKHQSNNKVKKTPEEKPPPNFKDNDDGDDDKKKKKKKKRKRGKSELDDSLTIENDDGFDETLLQLDDSELEKMAKKDKKSSPVKIQEDQSKASKASTTRNENKKSTPVKEEKIPDTIHRTPGSADKTTMPDSDQKRKNAMSYQRYLQRSGPKNPGSKVIPKGTPNSLQGLTFVISGVLDSMEREDAVDLIQRCGGRVTGSVSGKTNYIVVGDDAGESKLEKARKFGTKKLTEDTLLELIRSKSSMDDESGSSQDNFIEGTPKKKSKYFSNDNKIKKALDDDDNEDDIKGKLRKIIQVEAPKFKMKTEKPKRRNDSENSSDYGTLTESQSDTPIISESSQENTSTACLADGGLLWVDKYKPKSTKNIIGQAGDKSNVKKLTYWLQNWFKNHGKSNGKKMGRPAPWQSHDGSAFKAALLSGPPGVGKTTSVHLVCKELGFDIVEFNASDTRSKKLLQEDVSELLATKSIRGFFKDSSSFEKHVLVMDEVDGMAGNEDRGGIQELIQVIKATKVPVICMCNDRSHPKIRSLVNYCYDLRFSRPRMEQIKGAMMSVCFKEQVKISSEALEEIIINANNDIRQVLHNLSLWSIKSKSLSMEQAKNESTKAKKPLNLGPWDVVRKVFSASERSAMSFKEKEELFFQDYSLGPLFVQDQYVRVRPSKAKNDKKAALQLLSKAADSILLGDIVERIIRSENAWGLLPVQAIFSSVLPGHIMEGHIMGQIQFPVWLGKNSKRNRFDRMLQELQTHMRLTISGSKQAVNLDYAQILRDSITRPLLKCGTDGVPDSLRIMSEYNLTKEDVENLMEITLWPDKNDVFSQIDSKVKAALTRAYNKEGKAVPFATSISVKKRKTGDNEYDYEQEEEGGDDDYEEIDELELDAMIKKGKTKAKMEKEDSKIKTKKENSKSKKSENTKEQKREKTKDHKKK